MMKVEQDRILYTRDGKEYRGAIELWGREDSATLDLLEVWGVELTRSNYETLLIPFTNISHIQILYGATDEEG